MYRVKSITIEGFWGTHTAHVDFFTDTNFLIGRNGCGKTTLINMLAACLRLDFDTLIQSTFLKVCIELKGVLNNDVATIEITKTDPSFTSQNPLSIRFRLGKALEWVDIEEDALAPRRMLPRFRPSSPTKSYQVLKELLINDTLLTWLSIHRSSLERRYEDREGNSSTVDKKVSEIATNFGSFLSSLDTKASKESDAFRDKIFLSLLHNPREDFSNVWNTRQKDNSTPRKDALMRIFKEQFNMDESKFKTQIESHYRAVDKANKEFSKQSMGSGIETKYFMALRDDVRIQNVVSEWETVNIKLKEIYKPKDDFLLIMNELLINKNLMIDERNRPVIKTTEGGEFGPTLLSSGEKQLFIILGEVLLQESKPYIFIADEPELSLHVEWQGSLVNSVKKLNDNVQIIFATHSPDVVSSYGKNIINVEECIK